MAWSGLTHAYGSAEDTAQLLRQATSEDGQAVAAAISELHGSIFHQGTVYPATVAAVPFLAELACRARQCREEIVWMLGMLADPQHDGRSRWSRWCGRHSRWRWAAVLPNLGCPVP